MLLSDRTIELLDDGKLDELIEGSEFSRQKFLKGGGALVIGFSLVGSALAGSAKGAATRVAAGPPNANLIDSWIAINADNTATIAFGKIEITGAPTGLLMIAAEELDLTIQQVQHAAWDTDITAARLSGDLDSKIGLRAHERIISGHVDGGGRALRH